MTPRFNAAATPRTPREEIDTDMLCVTDLAARVRVRLNDPGHAFDFEVLPEETQAELREASDWLYRSAAALCYATASASPATTEEPPF